MGKSDLRRLAERLLHDPRRDSLGLGSDIEAQLDVLDAVAARFFRAPCEEALRHWQELLVDFPEPVDDEESCARLATHRMRLAEAIRAFDASPT